MYIFGADITIMSDYRWKSSFISSMTKVACCDVNCNPINHVVEKTLRSPTSKNTSVVSLNVKNCSHNINKIANIFALEAFSFLYYTKHHWLHGNFTDMVSSWDGRSLFVLFLLTILYCLCFWLSLWYLQTFLKIICFLPLFPAQHTSIFH